MRNCLGILAFMREPVPPARIRKPTLEKSGVSLSEEADEKRRVLDVDWEK